MKSSEIVRRMGRLWGRGAPRHILRYYHRRCATFDLTVTGAEHLRAAGPRPYLLVANHILIGPEGRMLTLLLRDTVLNPLAHSHRLFLLDCPADSFILSRIVQEETGRCLRVVARSNLGLWSKRPARRLLQERVTHPFGNGLREGLGYLPLDQTGRFQREFLQSVEGALGHGEPILIFPGRVRSVSDEARDSLLDGGIHPGAAHLARRYGVPVLPAYLAGAASWRAGQEAFVTFGPAFGCDGMSKGEVCRQIVERVQTCARGAGSMTSESDPQVAERPTEPPCDTAYHTAAEAQPSF